MLPSATEIVYALGLGEQLVGVTFECDEPPDARTEKTVVVGGRDTRGMTPGEIDDYVRGQMASGEDLYTLHSRALAALQPDLILTQDLCRVCALPSGPDRRTRWTTWAARPMCCRWIRTRSARCSTRSVKSGCAPGSRTRRGARRGLRARLDRITAQVAGRPVPGSR